MFKKYRTPLLILAVGFAGFGFYLTHSAQAATIYPAGSLLQPNDVTTTHIRDGTIQGIDLNTSSSFHMATTSVGTTTESARLTVQGVGTTTSDTLVTLDSTGATTTVIKDSGKVGIGTTTPTDTLSVEGTLNVTGQTTFNDVPYTWPSTQGSNGQAPVNNGSGTLSWATVGASHYTLVVTTDKTTTGGTATTTLLTVPAGVMNASSTVTLRGAFTCQGNTSHCGIAVVNGSGQTFLSAQNTPDTANTEETAFTVTIFPNYSASSQTTLLQGTVVDTSGTLASSNFSLLAGEGTSAFNLAAGFSVGLRINAVNGAGVATLNNYSFDVEP